MLDLNHGQTDQTREIIERAHMLRAEATRDFFRAMRDGVRNLFAGSARHA
ncbi:RSP_7527 family protein [Pontivivens insulae]|uniref:Uncharacterized protein n=1 Tax=Pontivivens insulae TaxID=1639689 RepID=A0A2R8A9J6_9RHOB|nr:hypothetical protein [Pontivivens insulae]RED12813.1 hypothetical protein DFR53_1944 [Pontivivens insulae]SPF28904.1 hypothetical protein POI8812_01207 [Pontivivens insulae]